MTSYAHAERVGIVFVNGLNGVSKIFEGISDGVKKGTRFEVFEYRIDGEFHETALHLWLDDNRIDVIIVLGRAAYQLVRHLDLKRPVIFGAQLLKPNGVSGVSLAADPQVILARLKDMVPKARRVFLVYNPRQSEWLKVIAEQKAAALGLEFHAYQVDSIRDAVRSFRSIFEEGRAGSDVIWLPLDPVAVNMKIVLPYVLRKAWNKKMVVISSMPSHAQHGSLFSVFPDYHGLGISLAKLAEKKVANKAMKPMVYPLSSLNIAVNLRTASHLGLKFSNQKRESFDLVFPSP